MKYFIDTEFIEGFTKPLFGKSRHFIDLISIGIVNLETGNDYYAISKEFDITYAWNVWQQRTGQGDRNNTEPREYWIRENILKPIFTELYRKHGHLSNLHHVDNKFTFHNFRRLIQLYGKTNKQIAEEIKDYISLRNKYWSDVNMDAYSRYERYNQTQRRRH
jgi:hypothetical protein